MNKRIFTILLVTVLSCSSIFAAKGFFAQNDTDNQIQGNAFYSITMNEDISASSLGGMVSFNSDLNEDLGIYLNLGLGKALDLTFDKFIGNLDNTTIFILQAGPYYKNQINENITLKFGAGFDLTRFTVGSNTAKPSLSLTGVGLMGAFEAEVQDNLSLVASINVGIDFSGSYKYINGPITVEGNLKDYGVVFTIMPTVGVSYKF